MSCDWLTGIPQVSIPDAVIKEAVGLSIVEARDTDIKLLRFATALEDPA